MQPPPTMPDMQLRLPPALASEADDKAVDLVRRYLAPDDALTGGVAYTGSLLEPWAGGGENGPHLNRVTDADLMAVTFLNVKIHPRAAIEILMRKAGDISTLLAEIPPGLPLHEATPQLIAPGSHADRLWRTLKDIKHVGPVIASKICARKRPHLLPVYDELVRALVGVSWKDSWEAMRQTLAADNGALAERLTRIGQAAGVTGVSVLRVFDIIAWMQASGHDDPST